MGDGRRPPRAPRSTSWCRRTCRWARCSRCSQDVRRPARAEPVDRLRGRRRRPAAGASSSRTRRRCTRPRPPSSPSRSRSPRSGTCPTFVRAQDEHRWAPEFAESLADRRVLLLGYGGVGKAIAARLAPFEVELTAVAPRARGRRRDAGARRRASCPSCSPEAEIVIVTLPGGEATRHIVDDAVPRGAARRRAGRQRRPRSAHRHRRPRRRTCERGRIRAALDVTDPEPLPADHPLWGLPGVLIVAARRRRLERDAAARRAADPHADRADAGGRAPAERRLRELSPHRRSTSAPDHRSPHSTASAPCAVGTRRRRGRRSASRPARPSGRAR